MSHIWGPLYPCFCPPSVLLFLLIYNIFTLKLKYNLFSGAWSEAFDTITGLMFRKWMKAWHYNFSQSCLYIFVDCETRKTFNGTSVVTQCLEDLCNAAMTMLHTALMTWLFMTCLKYFQLLPSWVTVATRVHRVDQVPFLMHSS